MGVADDRAHESFGSVSDEIPTASAVPPVDPPGPGGVEDELRIGRSPAASTLERPGSKIGRYKLLQQIGEGGFGVVFLAEQEHPVRRKVALKVIKPGMDTKQVIARFEAERQALALMDHPSIAKVFDGGVTPSGRPYFVMELVRGVPITTYCDEQKLTTRERLELFAQVCRAVQHAHQKGIIHRDLKPSNVLVSLQDDPGAPGLPKVIDFGIAKAAGARLTDKTLFTEFRQMVGTPEYMSPEQAGQAGMDADTRSDIYSLGVLLYELLTGTTPFDAKQLRQAAYAEVQRIIREVEPPKPSTRLSTMADETLGKVAERRKAEPKRLGRTVRGELDWIVMKCLEKDRNRRYETANGLAADVARHLSGEPVSAGPPSATYRLRKFVSKHRLGVSAAAAAVLVLLLGLWAAVFAALWIKQSRDQLGEAITAKEGALKEKEDALGEKEDALKTAETNARTARIARHQLSVETADAIGHQNRWRQAMALYRGAEDGLDALGEPTLPAELGLWSGYRSAPLPLLTMGGASAGVVGGLRCVAVLPDGRHALSGGEDGKIRLWDLWTGRMLHLINAHQGGVRSLDLGPDGSTVLSAGSDGVVLTWKVRDGSIGKRPELAPAGSGALVRAVFSSTGTQVLCAYAGGRMVMLSTQPGVSARNLGLHPAPIRWAALVPEGDRAVSLGEDLVLRQWDTVTGKETGRAAGRTRAHVAHFALSPDGKWLLTEMEDHELALLERTTRGLERKRGLPDFSYTPATCFAFSPDPLYPLVLVGYADGDVKLWRTDPIGVLRTFVGDASDGAVRDVAFLPGSRAAVAVGDEGKLKVLDLGGWALEDLRRETDPSEGREVRTIKGHKSIVQRLAFSGDGHFVLASSDKGEARVVELASGQVIHAMPIANALCAFTHGAGGGPRAGPAVRVFIPPPHERVPPSGTAPAAVSHDGRMAAWLEKGRLKLVTASPAATQPAGSERILMSKAGSIPSLAFSGDGRWLLAGRSGGVLEAWDLKAGALLRGQPAQGTPGPTGELHALAASADGRWALAAERTPGRLWRWDLAGPQPVAQLVNWGFGTVGALAVNHDGTLALIAAEGGKTLHLWDLKHDRELRALMGHRDPVISAGFAPAPSARLVAVSCDAGSNLKIWYLSRPAEYEEMKLPVAKAQQALASGAGDPAALNTLADWFTLRGQSDWARALTGLAAAPAPRPTIEFVSLKAPPKAQPPAPSPPGARVVDLLALLDPERDLAPKHGAWRMEGGALVATGSAVPSADNNWHKQRARLEFPYEPPDEYDYRIEFTRVSRMPEQDGDAVVQTLAAPGGRTFNWNMGGWGNLHFGFQKIDGAEARHHSSTYRDFPQALLLDGQRRVSLVQVRKNGVRAYLNGSLLATWPHLDSFQVLLKGERPALGVGTWFARTIFHRAEVTEVSGAGKEWYPRQPVQRSAPATRPSTRSAAAPRPAVVAEAQPLLTGLVVRTSGSGHNVFIQSVRRPDQAPADPAPERPNEHRLLARKGYAVGAVVVGYDPRGEGNGRITGLRVVFQKIQGARLDRSVAYVSPWIGGRTVSELTLGDTRKWVVGVSPQRHPEGGIARLELEERDVAPSTRPVDLKALVRTDDQKWLRRPAGAAGEWGLVARGRGDKPLSIQIPYRPPQEYDFIVEFTLQADNGSVGLYLSRSFSTFRWVMSKGQSGFEDVVVAGTPHDLGSKDNPTVRPVGLTPHRRVRAEVRVRDGVVEAYIDNGKKPVARWQTRDYQDLQATPGRDRLDARFLGLSGFRGEVHFHKIELIDRTRVLNSKGPATREADGATGSKPIGQR